MKVVDFLMNNQLRVLIRCGVHAVGAAIAFVLLLVLWVMPQLAGIGTSSQQAKQMASNVKALSE